jgi:hypothetical protein
MPQLGGRRLAVFALTCAAGLGTAASASAKEVTLWACHGSNGAPLGAAPFGGAQTFGDGCGSAGTGFEAGGVRVLPSDLNGVSLRIPNGLELKRVAITRRTTGLGAEGGAGRYAATFKYYTGPQSNRALNSKELDSATTDVSGDVTADAPASGLASDASVAFTVTGAGAAAELQRVGLTVDDPADPTASVGGIGTPSMSAPAIDPNKEIGPGNDGLTHVAVWANDLGAGLWKAVLYVDGQEAGTVRYVNDGAGAACVTALDAGAPLPLNNDCQLSSNKDIPLDTRQWPDGPHTLAVKLYDASGRVADVLKDYATNFVNHPDPGNRSATLNIGSGSSTQQNGGGGNNNGAGGVAGESTTSCNSPRLSMELSQKPLRLSRGVPVLVSGKRYRFRGTLTCVVNGKRRSAPAKTPIELLNTIGKRTYRKGGATVRSNGKITMILAYKSSRTLVFRYTNPDGRRSQVKLKIKVVKKPR